MYKSIYDNIFITAIEDGELKEDVLNEIYHNVEAHQRIIQSIDAHIEQLLEHKDRVEDDIKSMIFQKESIEGSV